MRRDVSWPAVLVVTAAVAVTVFSGYLLATWPPEPPAPPPPGAEEAPGASPIPSPRSVETEAAPRLVVLGDSFSAQSPESGGPEWPTLLGESLDWEVRTEAVIGSGYLSPGSGGPFGARVSTVVQRSPDVIIVAGGVADLGEYPIDRIVVAADDVLSRLARQSPDAELVVVSPFSNGEPGPLTERLSSQLRQVARLNSAAYVDATGWLTNDDRLFGAEEDQPTDLGQSLIADQMERALIQEGIASAGEPGND